MSLSDNLRRLARERVPTAPAKRLGPITPTVYTKSWLRLLLGRQLQSPDFRVNGTNRTGQSTRFRIAPERFSTSNKF